ncbi:hypothetical protein GCM10010236_58320 [Streptomyces eurythermus]|nr:hypothetical protein GCM10010236_58320 [Streptomyces eurythermus]
MKCGRSMAVGRPGAMRFSPETVRAGTCLAYALEHRSPRKGRGGRWTAGSATRDPRPAREGPHAYALLWENSFSTGTPTLCRAREAQSRWKNSST